MKNPLRRIFGKDEAGFEFPKNLALNELSGPQNTPMNADESEQKIAYLLQDELTMKTLLANKMLQPYLFYAPAMNRAIKRDKRNAHIASCRVECGVIKDRCLMPASDYEANGSRVLDGLRVYLLDNITASIDGWTGHLATENVKQVKVTAEKRG